MADPLTTRKLSYAQNAEDVRVWRAFRASTGLTYVDVGANEPRHLSITASLHDLGWRGLLIEADPFLAAELRVRRPGDTVVECAAAGGPGELTFFRVAGTGLGTLDASEARAARARGFEVEEIVVRTESLDAILDEHSVTEVHFMSIDVEGAEALVLQGLSLDRHRPWVMCVEAVLPGTTTPSHSSWEARVLGAGYQYVAFDGVNRWYVADEHVDLAEALAVPFNAIDAGEHGWVTAGEAAAQRRADRASVRRAWQRELILNDVRTEVPRSEYEKQIGELRAALGGMEGSRSWRLSRRIARVGKGWTGRARRAVNRMPAPASRALIRRRHLRHVTENMTDLTDPAFLGSPPDDAIGWITPDGLPPAPEQGLDLSGFTRQDADGVRAWLASGPYDTDELLDRRVDNHGDELGRALAALRLRLRIADRAANPLWAGGNRVLFDARSLQTPAFGSRGIGRFAAAALLAARQAVGDHRLALLVDPGLDQLPDELAGDCTQVTRVTERTLPAYGVLIEPSPMTATPDPLIALLHSSARKIAFVFDFIPMHYPTVYLRHVAARAEYGAALDALRMYDDFVCISQLARTETARILGRPLSGPGALSAVVAWPRDLLPEGGMSAPSQGEGPIVVMTGDDGRKNTFGALAAIGAATSGDDAREVVVVGMAGQQTRVHHWSIAAAMRPGEATAADRIDDDELSRLLRDASLVVVASFDEGLSLPVVEALRAGATVVASDIPAHRELLGQGSFLADPRSPASLERAIRRHRSKGSTQARQARRLAAHQHASLEGVIGRKLADHAKSATVEIPPAAVYAGGRALRVGIGTPWPPQRSGVADYSAATTVELARLCDVTVYTTHDAEVAAAPGTRLKHASIGELLDAGSRHDVFVSVLGNSHFHVPFLEVMDRIDSVVVAHDTRMVELYLALRGRGGLEQLMLRGTAEERLLPPLDDQIDDMRLLQNAGFWEIARRARLLITHSRSTVDRISAETGVTPRTLLFSNYRQPDSSFRVGSRTQAARDRLGFDRGPLAGTLHLATFGFVDVRTKMIDVLVEAAAWLSQWGHRVSLHIVGAAAPSTAEDLLRRAREAGIAHVEITGFVSDERLRDYVLAVDLGVQLRISPLLGVSGPLSDLAAYGTAALGSRGVCVDVDSPAFIDRLPDEVSPVTLAEAIEFRLTHPMPADDRERMRVEYLSRKSPALYAHDLLDLLTEVGRTPNRREG